MSDVNEKTFQRKEISAENTFSQEIELEPGIWKISMLKEPANSTSTVQVQQRTKNETAGTGINETVPGGHSNMTRVGPGFIRIGVPTSSYGNQVNVELRATRASS